MKKNRVNPVFFKMLPLQGMFRHLNIAQMEMELSLFAFQAV